MKFMQRMCISTALRRYQNEHHHRHGLIALIKRKRLFYSAVLALSSDLGFVPSSLALLCLGFALSSLDLGSRSR